MVITRRTQRNCYYYSSLLIFLLTFTVSFRGFEGSAETTKLKLIHRHQLLLQRSHRNGVDRVKHLQDLLHGDEIRLRTISHKLRENNPTVYDRYFPDCSNASSKTDKHQPHRHHNASGELLMNSAADYGAGQYLVHLRVGSPAQRVVLVADTGSDLTWTNCEYRCNSSTASKCGRSPRKKLVFDARRSRSFRTVPCSSSACKIDLANLFSLTRCPSPLDPCEYDYRYSDGSEALGLFANETVTFALTNGRKKRLSNVLVGCTKSSTGPSLQASDGVMGLGYSNYSFALKASKAFGGKFSYCLVDHLSHKNVTSYLIFGPNKQASKGPHLNDTEKLRYTTLALGAIPPFYAVSVRGISINDTMLDIPNQTWDYSNGLGGVIFDSGTSLTVLTQPAYGHVMDALKRSLIEFDRLNLSIGPLEYCFKSTGFDGSMVPRLAVHFSDGARFEPPVKSYVIDAAPGVKCLGFANATWPGVSVIGNIMQQNHLWEFDLVNGRLGFTTSSCT